MVLLPGFNDGLLLDLSGLECMFCRSRKSCDLAPAASAAGLLAFKHIVSFSFGRLLSLASFRTAAWLGITDVWCLPAGCTILLRCSCSAGSRAGWCQARPLSQFQCASVPDVPKRPSAQLWLCFWVQLTPAASSAQCHLCCCCHLQPQGVVFDSPAVSGKPSAMCYVHRC